MKKKRFLSSQYAPFVIKHISMQLIHANINTLTYWMTEYGER